MYASVYPASEIIPNNGSALVTITLSASKDVSLGTYWVQLPPGICFGGEDVILTVTFLTRHENPKSCNYDFNCYICIESLFLLWWNSTPIF